MPWIEEHPATFIDPSAAPSNDEAGRRRWVLLLNSYQRDNLLWLLNLVGYGGRLGDEEAVDCEACRGQGGQCAHGPGVKHMKDCGTWITCYECDGTAKVLPNYGQAGSLGPFGIANTGDWVGEVAIMLGHPREKKEILDAEKTGKPNSTRKYAAERLKKEYGIDAS